MKNTVYVCRSNIHIANELYRYGTITPHLGEREPRRKKKTDEQKFRERSELKYNSRRNQCSDCHTARSATGHCLCED